MDILLKTPKRVWSFLNIINKLIKKNEKKIFLYSDMGFKDNVKAVFDYLIEHGYNRKYTIIVSLNDWEEYVETAERNVKYVSNNKGLLKFFSCKYCYYCFGKYPLKPSKNQMVFNLCHGMPLKRIGNMAKGNEKNDYNYFTYILCTSEYFRDIMKKSFNARDEQIVICGQPRTDEMLSEIPAEDEMTAKAELLGYENRFSKMMIWLPTFSDEAGGEMNILSEEQFEALDKMCRENDWTILVKLHPLSKLDINKYKHYNCINFITDTTLKEAHISFYSLLGMSSCLITDHSSVYYDYMLLDRPMGFVISGTNDYDGSKFVFDDPLSKMPGELLKSGNDFLKFAGKIMEGKDEFVHMRRKISEEFNRYCDNKNCERVLSYIRSCSDKRKHTSF